MQTTATHSALQCIERQVQRFRARIAGPFELRIPGQLWVAADLPLPYDLGGNVIVRVGGVRIEPGIFTHCVPVEAR